MTPGHAALAQRDLAAWQNGCSPCLQVYFLDRTHQQWLHPSANRIPVLVLDYDQVPLTGCTAC